MAENHSFLLEYDASFQCFRFTYFIKIFRLIVWFHQKQQNQIGFVYPPCPHVKLLGIHFMTITFILSDRGHAK